MFRIAVTVLALGCCAIPASASLTTYTTLSSFTTATLGQTFQSITFPSGNDGTSYTDTASGVIFSDTGGNSFLEGIASPAGWTTGSSLEATNCSTPGGCTTTLTITLPTAVTSVSMDLGLLVGFNQFQLTVSNTGSACVSTGSNCSNQNITSIPSTGVFFGVASTSPFTTFTIATEDTVSSLVLDGIQLGEAGGGGTADTPEAVTFLMIGGGLIMLRCGRRWLPRVA